MTDLDLRIVSLGAGVQSTALYLMALDGEIGPLPDYAIFADTQREPSWVYENLWRLVEEGGDRIPILIATAGDIGDAVRRKYGETEGRFASVPFWVVCQDGKYAPGRRQCTREFKIDVVKQELRRQLGLQPRQRAAGRFRVEEWIGISLDEASRAKPSRSSWFKTRWPLLLDKPMRRYQIKAWLKKRGWPEVGKSACVFCPYRQAAEYARWRDDEPELWNEAVAWDEMIRDGGKRRGIKSKQYLTKLLIPLVELPSVAEGARRCADQPVRRRVRRDVWRMSGQQTYHVFCDGCDERYVPKRKLRLLIDVRSEAAIAGWTDHTKSRRPHDLCPSCSVEYLAHNSTP